MKKSLLSTFILIWLSLHCFTAKADTIEEMAAYNQDKGICHTLIVMMKESVREKNQPAALFVSEFMDALATNAKMTPKEFIDYCVEITK